MTPSFSNKRSDCFFLFNGFGAFFNLNISNIERIRIEFGIDTDSDGIAEEYIDSQNDINDPASNHLSL